MKINLLRRRRKALGSARARAGKGRALSPLGWAAAAGFGWLAYAYLTLPDVRPLADTNPQTTAFVELRAREAHAAGKKPRHVQRWTPYSRISPNLKRAVLVAEDAAFWEHEGVDYDELQKSIELDWTRGLMRGASTITQQLAKNLYLSPSRNPIRKFRELIIARRLEAELDKARIFEIYLNVIEWGDGIWGAEAAARTYYGVPSAALGPSQAALLAGAIINPRLLNPAEPTPRLLRRQQIILKRMGAMTPPEPARPLTTPPPEPFEPLPGQPVAPDELPPPPADDSRARADPKQ
jgi:monofunctional biosynthetic peptidoglycan transglycosylase